MKTGNKATPIAFEDEMPPPGEHLRVVARDRNGNITETIADLGSPKEERTTTQAAGTRRLGEEIEK